MELIETLFPEEISTKSAYYQSYRSPIDREKALQQIAKAKAILNSKASTELEQGRPHTVRVQELFRYQSDGYRRTHNN